MVLSQDGKMINLNNIRAIFASYFYNIQKNTLLYPISQNADHGGSRAWEKPGSCNANKEQ